MKIPTLPTAVLALTVMSAAATDFTLLDSGAQAKALIPSAANGGNDPGYQWRLEADPANINSWLSGTTGVGYDSNTGSGGNYVPQTGLNVGAMEDINGSVFIRIPFTVNAADLPAFRTLMLKMRYDDGFTAYINGTKVASALEPNNLAWNSLTMNGTGHTADLVGWEDFPIDQHLSLLHAGLNMLAIQGLNNTLDSSDLLMVPQLVATDVVPPPQPRWPAPVFVTVPGTGTLTRPVAIRNARDGTGHLYIVEQNGTIRRLSGTTRTDFLDIDARVNSGDNEQGLLGLAFPPGFAQSRRFYVSYTASNGALTLSRFRTLAANPNAGDPNSEQILLSVPHASNGNHNGSDIHFAKDGYLYWSTGDGGGGGDTQNNAQNPASLLGKMLRLDVEGHATGGSLIPASNPWAAAGDNVMDQIYHLGLRNPWRWSFDRLTGDMWIGDVGQDVSYEEVDFVRGNTPGLNFQWRRREGFHDFSAGTVYGPGVVTEPIMEKTGDRSVTGGYVYRGLRFPRMQGFYFYGDYISGRFYGVVQDETGAWRSNTFTLTVPSVTTFGEDEAGELYWANRNGTISRIEDGGSDSHYLSVVSHTITENGRLSFTWGAANTKSYVPEVSTNLVNWTAAGPAQTGTATFRLTFTETADPPVGTGKRYFRAREL